MNYGGGPAKRAEIVTYLRLCKPRGYAPTVREIGEAVNLRSSSSVWYHLIQLETEGAILSELGRIRTWRVAS